MKIAILTQPLRYNYGGILQNFALQTVLKRMGHKVVTLDPKRYRYTWWQYLRYSLQHFIGRYIKGHRHTVVFEEWEKDKPMRTMGRHTFSFINHYIRRKEYTDLSQDIHSKDYDAYIVGSDQVWRPEYNPNLLNMFLDFTSGWDVKRVAYAASFGVDTWSQPHEVTVKCSDLFKNFNWISVREDSGVALCRDVFDVEATHVLDPTLLLTKEDYISILKLNKVKKSDGNLLVYILDYTNEIEETIEQIAEEKNLVPFRVNSDVEDIKIEDINQKIQPPVEQWVRGFYDAGYVITDSFHACVFSIIFNKPFVLFINNYRGSSRFQSLFQQLSLNELVKSKVGNCIVFNKPTPEVVCKLTQLRKTSLNWLNDALL